MISYLTDVPRVKNVMDIMSVSVYVIGILTIIHLTSTYILIKSILAIKHSKSIRMAEQYNQISKFSVLGFNKLFVYLALLCACFIVQFVTHKEHIYDSKQMTYPPPVTVMSTVIFTFTCVYFVCIKSKIRAFVKRRLRGYFESSFPQVNLKSIRSIRSKNIGK